MQVSSPFMLANLNSTSNPITYRMRRPASRVIQNVY